MSEKQGYLLIKIAFEKYPTHNQHIVEKKIENVFEYIFLSLFRFILILV